MQTTLGRVMGKCRGRKEICLSEEQKGKVQISEVVGGKARELGMTKGQVTKVVGQGKELYTVSKYLQGQACGCPGEPCATNDPFIICV